MVRVRVVVMRRHHHLEQLGLHRAAHAAAQHGVGPRLVGWMRAGRSAPLATKTLLFVGEGDPIMATTDRVPKSMPLSIAPGAGGRKFRAFDKTTGQVLWETELAAGTTGAPMTYLFEGKQYILVAIGAREHAAEFVALSLP